MLINEINNKEISNNHQVIGSNVVRIVKLLGLTLWSKEIIDIKFDCDKTGVNLANSVRWGLITQSPKEISVI